MEWNYIEESNKLYRGLHYIKNRDISILEFQMRIFDIACMEETPLIEKLRFVKIIHENLKDFASVRFANADADVRNQLKHTIEIIYQALGMFIDHVSPDDLGSLEDFPVLNCHESVPAGTGRYLYAGESTNEAVNEVDALLDVHRRMLDRVIFYCNTYGLDDDYDDIPGILAAIQVPRSIFTIDQGIAMLTRKLDPSLEYPPFVPKRFEKVDYYTELRDRDILFRCPYVSYDTYLDFLNQMAENPEISHIMITLYRTAKHSKVIKLLHKAARYGKEIFVFVEPKARGNENDNIQKILSMKQTGFHVACAYYNYKVHAKMCCSVSLDGTIYTHIGTGNYNENTASVYTDYHLLTTNVAVADRAMEIFHALFTKDYIPSAGPTTSLFTSPVDFRTKINSCIEKEISKGKNGRIWLKCNSLCDCAIIDKLYHAANAGVDVRIICRTGCSMTYHKNIQIRSKVGRFLEHDRFYIFGDEAYISSADLLLRNIDKRVELLCLIPKDHAKLLYETFNTLWNDPHIHHMVEDGSWEIKK